MLEAMSLEQFHPAVAAFFCKHFDQPTAVQKQSWVSIKDARHTLLAAPTGSGKTLAAFLAAIDDLVQESRSAPLFAPATRLPASAKKCVAAPRIF